MNTKQKEALAAYDELNDVSTAKNYTDTGDAWLVLHKLAAALRDQLLAEQGSSGRPAAQAGCADPAHNDNCDEYDEKGSPEREGNLGEVIDRRVQVYGNVEESWTRIAEVWSGLAGFHINATTAALMMIGLKGVRSTYAPDYADNSDDIEGYLDIFRSLVGEDMINVRSVNEYIEKKWPNG